MPHIAHIALLVNSYSEALHFYTNILNFTLIEDTDLSHEKPGKRWVVISPPNSPNPATTILLAQADSPEQLAAVGNQSGGRVFLFLATDDLDRDYKRYKEAGVKFTKEPWTTTYGKVAVWEDLYGNRWDLIEYAKE